MSVLILDRVSVSLGSRAALRSVTLSVQPGEMVALVGPNGAGKTTLMRAALGLVPVHGGAIELSGEPINTLSPEARARRAAYLAQERTVAWSLTGGDIAALGRFAWGGGRAYDALDADSRAAVDFALEAADATALKDRPVHQLSGGEQARLHLARLLAASAPLLLADEPVAGLDPCHQLEALSALKAQTECGAAILVSLHDLTLAERFADQIAVLETGRLATIGPAQSVLDDAVLKQVFGVIRRTDGGFDRA